MYIYYDHIIAGARQIFHKNFFFLFYKENFPGSEKKNFILKNLGGDCNINEIINNNNLSC
jgi:hypothetical protein